MVKATKKMCKYCNNNDGNYRTKYGANAGACGFEYCDELDFEGTDFYHWGNTPEFDNDDSYSSYYAPPLERPVNDDY